MNIPYFNIVMRCDHINQVEAKLPNNLYFKMYHPGDEKYWAEIETKAQEFDSKDKAIEYFNKEFLPHQELLPFTMVFVFNQNQAIATCTAWYGYKQNKKQALLHWLATIPEYQSQGIAKAISAKVLNIFKSQNQLPIYLNTQPCSYKAIKIYHDFGFNILKTETLDQHQNEYPQAIKVLKTLLYPQVYENLIKNAK